MVFKRNHRQHRRKAGGPNRHSLARGQSGWQWDEPIGLDTGFLRVAAPMRFSDPPASQNHFVSGGVTAASVASQQLSAQNFRALDIFVVQANTNSVLSHFCSLCAGLGLLSKSDSIAPES